LAVINTIKPNDEQMYFSFFSQVQKELDYIVPFFPMTESEH